MEYSLPVPPSPNLPNDLSIKLYPHLCFFEGTIVSIGRGTDKQFQVIGHPDLKTNFQFTPEPNLGSKHPKHNGRVCYGYNLKNNPDFKIDSTKLKINVLLKLYKKLKDKNFFSHSDFFDKLAGSDKLRKMILKDKTEKEIRKEWEKDLSEFKHIRKKYLMYKDF